MSEKTYTVSFVGEHVVLTTYVSCAGGKKKAEQTAMELIQDYYGWNMTDTTWLYVNVEQE